MKDKISEISDEQQNLQDSGVNSAVAEAINALVNLGYKTKDAKNILDISCYLVSYVPPGLEPVCGRGVA